MALTESQRRETAAALKRHGWFLPPLDKAFATGGGAEVYRCYNLALVQKELAFAGVAGVAPGLHALGIGGPRLEDDAERKEKAACVALDELFRGLVENECLAVVKIPHRQDDRLRREVEAMRRCAHPHLTRILAVDDASPPAWFVMEYHPKGTVEDLRTRLRGRPLEVLRQIRPVAGALAAVHEANLVHRDVKPRNILVSREGKWILSDFGIVFDVEEERLTETAEHVWSRDWRPDWVARRSAGDYTARVDVFMLAKVIHALVLGDNPPASQVRVQPDCDLRHVFPKIDGIDMLQAFVEQHVTLREEDCASGDARELVGRIDDLIRSMDGSSSETLLFNWLAAGTSASVGANSNPNRLSSQVYLGRRYRRICGKARLFRNGGSSIPQGFTIQDVAARAPAMESTKQGITGEVPHWVGAWTDEMVLTLPADFRPGWYELSVPADGSATLTGFVLFGMEGSPAPTPDKSLGDVTPRRKATTRLDQV